MSKNFLSGYINIEEWCLENGFNKTQVLRVSRENNLRIAKVANSTFVIKQDLEDFLYRAIIENTRTRRDRIEARKSRYQRNKIISENFNSIFNISNDVEARLFIKFIRENQEGLNSLKNAFIEWRPAHLNDPDIINPESNQNGDAS